MKDRKFRLTSVIGAVAILALAFVVLGRFPASADPGSYSLYTTIGNVTSTYSSPGDLVNPSLVSYSNGSTGDIYVFNNSSNMPGADSTHRVITEFADNGTTNYTFVQNIIIDVSSFNGNPPQGMTIDNSGNIYMTAPSGYLVAKYPPTGGVPACLGPTSGVSDSGAYSGFEIGVPSIDQTDNSVIVAGQFSPNGSDIYGMAHILATGNPATDVPQLFVRTNGESNGNSYSVQNIVAAPNGDYFAIGYFQISGKSYNVIKVHPTTGAITPIAPPNVTGLNNPAQSASIYNLNSINIDDNGNIYLSGNFGVTTDGNYQNATLLKLDSSGNFVSAITDVGSGAGQVQPIGGMNMVSINTHSQYVYVLDMSNSPAKLKVYAPDNSTPGNPNTSPQPSTPPTVSVDTGTGTVIVTPSDPGSSTTITNQGTDGQSGGTPDTTVVVTPQDSGGVSHTTTTTDSNGDSTTTTTNVDPNGSVTITTTTPDGTPMPGSSTAATNPDGSTTSTVNTVNPDGTTTSSTTTVTPNGQGGSDTTTTTTVMAPNGDSDTTTVTTSTNGSGGSAGTVDVVLPGIKDGNNYTTTVTSNNGAGSSAPVVINWRAGKTPGSPNTGRR